MVQEMIMASSHVERDLTLVEYRKHLESLESLVSRKIKELRS